MPFFNVFTAKRLADVCESQGIDFGNVDGNPDVVYTPAVTLWAFLSQMLFTGEQRSCTAAVARECEAQLPDEWRWKKRRVIRVDGSTFSLPDTPQNQAGPTFGRCPPQSSLQAEGLGIEIVTRLHQHRQADFRRGRRLGADDHLVDWPKPQRPDWLDQDTYHRLPATLNVREMKFAVRTRGFRTLRDETTVTREDLADLYRQRWQAELDLRSIKTTMNLKVLRCKTPEMARTELLMGLLAYNLVRHSPLQAATADCSPRQLSFCAAQQFLANTWLLTAVSSHNQRSLIELRLIHSASHRVGHRPNRIEPRAIKRRPKAYDWLTTPRKIAHDQLLIGSST